MNPELQTLFQEGAPPPAAIDTFLAERTFPLVDDNAITFIWRGEAEAVYLRCWISGLDTAQPFERLDGTDLWAVTIELPRRSRIEYKFEVVAHGGRELVLDPFNPVLARDPFGANSVCQGAGYERPDWTLANPAARPGRLQAVQLESPAFGGNRHFNVYLPARYRENSSYPLLLVHDGDDYMKFADLKTVLDNLIDALEIPAMVVALTQSPDRLKEYSGDERHATFLAEELLPFMQNHYSLIDRPEARGIMGASFGGVASLHTAWRYPQLFGNLFLQSGSFAFSDLGRHQRGPAFDPVVKFMNEFRKNPGRPADRIFMSCGIYESLIYENRSLVPRLQAQDINVKYEEARDAHNWENWRDRQRNGLCWLFPGPQWLVYE